MNDIKQEQLENYNINSFFSFEESEKEISFLKKFLIYILLCPISFSMYYLSKRINVNENKALKNKLRYFNPIIKQGFWSNTITWVARDKPLTNDELDNLCK